MELRKYIKKWIFLPLIGFLIFFILIVINQCIQLVNNLFALSPVLGYLGIVFIIFILIYFILYPLINILSYSVVPEMPKEINSPEYTAYVDRMHEIMKNNKFIKSKNLVFTEDKEKDLQRAFQLLDEETDVFTKKEAQAVFLTTTVSQNGTLDGIFVLKSLLKLIWKIIHLYESRPSIKKLIYIYSNVAATVLISRGIEDMDLIEDQVEPLIGSLLGGSVMTLIPGAAPVTSLVVSSVMQGSINALLTLRCGFIAQRYMGSLVDPDRKALRKSASLEALSKIGEIIRENTLPIIKSFGNAAKSAAKNAAYQAVKPSFLNRRKDTEEDIDFKE